MVFINVKHMVILINTYYLYQTAERLFGKALALLQSESS
jgi:hypothetical protein